MHFKLYFQDGTEIQRYHFQSEEERKQNFPFQQHIVYSNGLSSIEQYQYDRNSVQLDQYLSPNTPSDGIHIQLTKTCFVFLVSVVGTLTYRSTAAPIQQISIRPDYEISR